MKRILIIDDDMDMCNLLGRFLQKKGFETEAAHNGNKGIAKFKESKFDVVLCDFRLGDKEGREVLTQVVAPILRVQTADRQHGIYHLPTRERTCA